MERAMRRFKQQLAEEEAKDILRKGSHGVLSLMGADATPYGVPLNYVYDGDRHIYFHGAVEGHKIDCINAHPCGSFCVVGQDRIVPEEFTSYFRSVIARGSIRVVEEQEEIRKGLLLLCEKFSPGLNPEAEIAKSLSHVAVLRLNIESLTGKKAIELVDKHDFKKNT
ncbi:MAG: pyridoxamine 5'-phosphate oxidase family protein [Bacteroidales bacterium]|nr:pyridoxamine 5'-phosphate oxidase family protein [Bacteroidales bacterium]